MVSKTGCRSVREPLITRRMSDVAVWRSRAWPRSVLRVCSSVMRRTFSIAMTAWWAKVVTSSICRSVKGSTSSFQIVNAPTRSSPFIIGTASAVRMGST